MSDELINTPQEEQETEIFGIDASTDGRRNSFTLTCPTLGQSMNYAACLWRQNVLAAPNVKTPADWSACDSAGKCGNCRAMQMREEELIAGRSIYFRSRETILKGLRQAREWVMPSFGSRKPAPPAPKPATHVLDGVGSAPTYADAVEHLARTAAAPAAPEPRVIPIAPAVPIQQAVALPGESPLAMARRLRAAQQQVTP